mgnify:CR=1 FL=1|tara:strand:+ start:212 stop:778 length:567 start_codon:yes stop_codon:yes gene_type:complete
MLIFLHIPHTGGRNLGRWLWDKQISYKRLHNSNDLKECEINEKDILYFIIRNPVERCYKEFLHYSERLDIVGVVNHLTKDLFKNKDYKDYKDYFSLEINCNVYCKFILLRCDFDKPITEDEFENMNIQRLKYDFFENLNKLPKLSEILKQEINLATPKYKNDITIPDEIKKFIIEKNKYDIMFLKTFK